VKAVPTVRASFGGANRSVLETSFSLRSIAVRWPIRLQILIPFALLQVGAVVTLTVLAASVAIRRAEGETGLRLRQVVETLSSLRVNYTPRMLEQLRGLLGADVFVRDDAGRIVEATVSPAQRPDDLPGRDTTETIDFSRLGEAPRVQRGSESFLAVSIPVESPPRGDLLLLVPEAAWKTQRWEAATPPLIVGGITLILVIGLSTWLASHLARRIRDMETQVAQIANGDFTPVPLPETQDELRDLGASVNRMCESLRQMSHQIRSTERAGLIAQLAGGLAHQLRNAITGARMAVQLHIRRCPEKNDESLTVALRQLTLTEEQMKGILTLHRREHPVSVAGELSTIVDDVLRLVDPACQHGNVTLTAAADVPALRLKDGEAIRAALLNLVLNAIEACGPGGTVEIAFAEREKKGPGEGRGGAAGEIDIRVIDSGPGLAPGVADSLFDPFVTTKPEGVGLGLALARQAAEIHGGVVSAARTDNRTVFTLRLPRTPGSP